MFVTAILRDDSTLYVSQVFGPFPTEGEAEAFGKQQSGEAEATQDEYGRFVTDDGMVLFSVHSLINKS